VIYQENRLQAISK